MITELKIELTNKCNRYCIHCSSNAENINIKELSYEDVKRLLLEAKKLNIKSIVYTGGEPCLYNQIENLVRLTKEQGFIVKLYSFLPRTNESLIKYKKILKAGVDEIIYSLSDSLTEVDVDRQYTYQAFFDKIFENSSNCKLSFHYVLLKKHISKLDYINEIVELFKNRKYFKQIKLLRFVPHGRGDESMNLKKEDYLTLKEFYGNSPYKNYIKLGRPWNILEINNKPCKLADEIMIIGYDGVAYPCDSLKYFTELGISGNIKENSLSELYNSSYFTRLRMYKYTNSCIKECLGQKLLKEKL